MDREIVIRPATIADAAAVAGVYNHYVRETWVTFDEYQFVVCPVLLGSGRPLLSGVSRNSGLDLVEAKQYQSGDVMIRYARPN